MNANHRFAAATIACVMMAMMANVAQAEPSAKRPIIVFETHVGQRSLYAMGALREELEDTGFAARPETILKLVGGRAPRPGVEDENVTAAAVKRQVEAGYDAFTQARFADAVKILTKAIESIQRNPALFVLDTSNSTMVFNAYVSLALSLARLGKAPESVATMTELIRMFRSQPVSRVEYGPDAEKFYSSVYKQVLAMGRGQLAIRVGNVKAMIFVDGQIRGLGEVNLADLIPGTYQVFVQVPGTTGRRYEIEVRSGDASTLEVAWDIDSSLWVTKPWVGFQFATEAERGKDATYASALARRWNIGDMVVVIGPTIREGKQVIAGSLYQTNGTELRAAFVNNSDAADEDALRSLSVFLANGTKGKGIHIVADAEGSRAPARANARRSSRAGKWLIYGGVAVVAIGAGVFAFDQDEGPNAPLIYYDTAPAGVAIGAVGIAAVGVGIYLRLRGKGRTASAPTVSVNASHATLGWAGSF